MAAGQPLVLLINERTAAGAEIMAAALQTHRRATVVGTESGGAGSVQTVIALPDDQGALRLTTARIYLASGRALEGQGVVPDIVVTQPSESSPGSGDAAADPQLHRALQALRQSKRR